MAQVTVMTARRCAMLALVASAMVLGSVGQSHAEMLVFVNGRMLSVQDYRVTGDTITVTLRQGGEASFARSLIARIEPDEVPDATDGASDSIASADRAALAARPFADLIETVALKYGLDPALVHAVVETESNYHPGATSRVGARGLMQVMPATGRELGVSSTRRLFDPRANVEAGVKYLKALLQQFNGNLTNALAAYNAGPAAVIKYGGVPPFRETQAYVRKVLSRFRR